MLGSWEFDDTLSLSLAQDVVSHNLHELACFLHHALAVTIAGDALVYNLNNLSY